MPGFVKRRGWYVRMSKTARHCAACREYHPRTYVRRGLRDLTAWTAR